MRDVRDATPRRMRTWRTVEKLGLPPPKMAKRAEMSAALPAASTRRGASDAGTRSWLRLRPGLGLGLGEALGTAGEAGTAST